MSRYDEDAILRNNFAQTPDQSKNCAFQTDDQSKNGFAFSTLPRPLLRRLLPVLRGLLPDQMEGRNVIGIRPERQRQGLEMQADSAIGDS